MPTKILITLLLVFSLCTFHSSRVLVKPSTVGGFPIPKCAEDILHSLDDLYQSYTAKDLDGFKKAVTDLADEIKECSKPQTVSLLKTDTSCTDDLQKLLGDLQHIVENITDVNEIEQTFQDIMAIFSRIAGECMPSSHASALSTTMKIQETKNVGNIESCIADVIKIVNEIAKMIQAKDWSQIPAALSDIVAAVKDCSNKNDFSVLLKSVHMDQSCIDDVSAVEADLMDIVKKAESHDVMGAMADLMDVKGKFDHYKQNCWNADCETYIQNIFDDLKKLKDDASKRDFDSFKNDLLDSVTKASQFKQNCVPM